MQQQSLELQRLHWNFRGIHVTIFDSPLSHRRSHAAGHVKTGMLIHTEHAGEAGGAHP